MSNTFFISDHHLGHNHILKFMPNRPATNLEEHLEWLVERHNSVVGKRDTTYFLGDIAFNMSAYENLTRFRGNKILIMGNHDKSANNLAKYFSSIFGILSKFGLWLSHCPIHPIELRGKPNVHGHCLPIDYEVLTVNKGFIKLSDIKLGEEVFAYDNGEIKKSKVLDKVRHKYSGDMYKFNIPKFSQLMTSNHHLKLKNNEYRSIKWCIDNDLSSADIPLYASEYELNMEDEYSDDLLRFIVAVCADGCFEKNSSPIRFHIKKKRKQDRLCSILYNLGQTLVWNNNRSKGIDPKFGNDVKKLIGEPKQLPIWLTKLSTRQIKIVIEELQYWDGCKVSGSGYQVGTSKINEVNLIQELLLRVGILSNANYRIKKNSWVITYNTSKSLGNNKRKKLKKYMTTIHVSEFDVGCITTEYNSFITRTPEGSVEITGNTHTESIPDPMYLNVSADVLGGVPIELGEVRSILNV